MTPAPSRSPKRGALASARVAPASVHYGTAVEIRAMRADVLDAAYTANPARFRHRRPQPPALPTVAWINDPDKPLTQSA